MREKLKRFEQKISDFQSFDLSAKLAVSALDSQGVAPMSSALRAHCLEIDSVFKSVPKTMGRSKSQAKHIDNQQMVDRLKSKQKISGIRIKKSISPVKQPC